MYDEDVGPDHPVLDRRGKDSGFLANLQRKLAAAAGLLLAGLALLAPSIGLGRGPEFILYRLISTSRSDVLLIGVALCIFAAIFTNKSYSIIRGYARRFEIHNTLADSAKADPTCRRGDLRFLLIQVVAASTIAITLFWLNRRNLLSYIDGQYLLTLIDNQRQFGTRLPSFSINPLQGLGDIWYFTNTTWIPEFLMARIFDAPNVRVVVLQFAAFTEVFLAVSLLSYWLNGSIVKAAASGWLAGLIIFPFTYPALIYNVVPDAPQFAFLVSVPIAIVPLLFSIGRHSALWDAGASCAIVLLMWIQFLALGLFVALTYPFLVFVGMALLIGSRRNRATLLRRVIWGVLIVVALVASGLPQILLAFVSDTAFQFFPADLARDAHTLGDGSLLFRLSEPIGVLVAAIGLVGAGYGSVFGSDRARVLGLATWALVFCILAASLIYEVLGFRGAKPIYYEYVLWPIYAIFVVSVLSSLWIAVPRLAAVDRLRPLAHHAAWIGLPLFAIVVLHGANYLKGDENSRPNIYPPKSSAIIESLRQSIGLSPGHMFNGRVVTMTSSESPGRSWGDAFGYDLSLIRSIGNDHRTIGMWFYNIPTLIEFNHAIRPLLFAVTKSFLARDRDGQQLNILNFNHADNRVLRLLGVRYLVTDQRAPVDGAQRIRTMQVPGLPLPLGLDELANPNIGVSPTKVVIDKGRGAMLRLSDSEFDFETTAILPGEIETPLTKAADISISVENGGLRIRASSVDKSLVVIPFQYSHCLHALSRQSGKQVKLVRADFLLTGILFRGTLDADIEYQQGPFRGALCGLSDLREDQQALGRDE